MKMEKPRRFCRCKPKQAGLYSGLQPSCYNKYVKELLSGSSDCAYRVDENDEKFIYVYEKG